MTVNELVGLQHELEEELQRLGPVHFIRQLVARAIGAHVLAYDSQQLPGQRRSTRFLFVDGAGAEAFLTVFSELRPDGLAGYTLHAERRAAA